MVVAIGSSFAMSAVETVLIIFLATIVCRLTAVILLQENSQEGDN